MAKIVRSPSGARGAETRAQILEAAGRLFGQVGFRKTTVTGIAEACGVSKATVYLYFRNKDDVYQSLARQKSQLIHERNRAAAEAKTHFTDQLRAYIVSRYRSVREMLQQYDVQSRHLLEDREVLDGVNAEYMDKELQLIQSILETGQQAGEVGDIDTRLAAVAITGTLRSLDTPWIFHLEAIDVEARADDLLQLFLHGLAPTKEHA